MKIRVFFDNEAKNPDEKVGFQCNVRGGSKKKILALLDQLRAAVEAAPGQDRLEVE